MNKYIVYVYDTMSDCNKGHPTSCHEVTAEDRVSAETEIHARIWEEYRIHPKSIISTEVQESDE